MTIRHPAIHDAYSSLWEKERGGESLSDRQVHVCYVQYTQNTQEGKEMGKERGR